MFLRILPLAIALVAAASSPTKAGSHTRRDESSLLQPLSIKSVHENANMKLIQTFQIGDPASPKKTIVDIYESQSSAPSLAKRDATPAPKPAPNPIPPKEEIPGITKPLDLTPSECKPVCFPGTYHPPLKTDCDALVDAQLYHSIGSLRIKPGWTVLVHAGTCVVVFQHPVGKPENNLTFEYNWAMLGQVILDIQKKCDKPDALSIGGACKIEKYLKYNFKNVLISLQLYIPPESSAQS